MSEEVIPDYANTLRDIFKATIEGINCELTDDPELIERDIIEYDSRMRINGMEKFNNPCYVTGISLYLSENALNAHDACGAVAIYGNRDCGENFMKAIDEKGFDDNDHEITLKCFGEFALGIVNKFKEKIPSLGINEVVASEPINSLNEIASGIDFPYKEYQYYQGKFDVWKEKAFAFDIVLSLK